MNPLLDSDLPLYELALNSNPALDLLTVSPGTFKSLISSLVGLLIDQQLGATVLAKLPQGTAWQTELRQYASLPDLSHDIYLLSSHRDDLLEGLSGTPTPQPEEVVVTEGVEMDSVDDESLGELSGEKVLVHPPGMTFLQLAHETLRREYFVLVGTEQFCSLLLAYRPRSHPPQKSTDLIATGATHPESPLEEGRDRKHSLVLLWSFDPSLIRSLLQPLQRSVRANGESGKAPEITGARVSDLGNLLQRWESALEREVPSIDQGSVERLLGRLTCRIEELGGRVATYRKHAEISEELTFQNQHLLNNLRLKDEFLNNVGQELRTPLTNMKTALTLLNSPNLRPPQRQRYMDLLSRECDRQSSLITSLLELVQLEQVAEQATFHPLRLADIVPGVVSTYQPLAEEKGLRLAYTIPGELPSVSCIHDWLKRIVINLLDNGIKFTPRGGQVWVRAKQQGDYVQLEFRDSGIGIAASELPKVFDRFYRVRQPAGEDSGGVGLGLTIVQQLLLHCGGSISVKSKVGEGSVFNVLLPVYKSFSEGGMSPADTPE